MTIGTDESTKELGLDAYFNSLPVTMFTAFRWKTGEVTETNRTPARLGPSQKKSSKPKMSQVVLVFGEDILRTNLYK